MERIIMRSAGLLVATLMVAMSFNYQVIKASDAEAEAEAVVPPEGEEVSVSTFYENLAPSGTWVQDETYGWVWQPAVVVSNADWQPYCDNGHWTLTNEGWYFESDYKWGWAAFHYGRWVRHGTLRWVWIPDTEWAPAWVTFRECDDGIGWSPLPPGAEFRAGVGFSWKGATVAFGCDFGLVEADFVFVSWGNFTDHDCWKHGWDRKHVHEKWGHCIDRNKYVIEHGRICNHGLEVVIVEKHLGHKLDVVRVSDRHPGPGQRVSEKRKGNVIHSYRPDVSKKSPRDPKAAAENRKQKDLERKKFNEEKRTRTGPVGPRKPESRSTTPHEERKMPPQKTHEQKAQEPHQKPPTHEAPKPQQSHHEAPKPQQPAHHEAPKPQQHHEAPKPQQPAHHEAAPQPPSGPTPPKHR